MSTNDREDALARALDLLAEDDPARADPRLVRDPVLAAEARSARETAADVWLAVSPLRAAPGDVLPEILAKIAPAPEPAAFRRRTGLAIASGWAAAAMIALAWFVRSDRDAPFAPAIAGVQPGAPAVGDERLPLAGHFPSEEPSRRVDRDRLHDELVRLRRALAVERDGGNATLRPRVMELTPPGSPAAADPAAAKARLMAILANALRGALEDQAADPPTLVIERGWFPNGELRLADDQWVRHRNFPVEDWNEHALWKSEDGRFYDPASGLLWEKDFGSSDFIGRRASAGIDLAGFLPPGEAEVPAPPMLTQSAPAGFLIEDPASGNTHLVVEGLKPLSAQELSAGSGYYFVANTASNGWLSLPLNQAGGSAGATSLSFSAPGGLRDFSLVLADGRGGEIVIINGGN